MEKREHDAAASLSSAEEAQLLRFEQMSEAATARRGAIAATAATDEEREPRPQPQPQPQLSPEPGPRTPNPEPQP